MRLEFGVVGRAEEAGGCIYACLCVCVPSLLRAWDQAKPCLLCNKGTNLAGLFGNLFVRIVVVQVWSEEISFEKTVDRTSSG